jgi:hypothetical protein
MEERLAHADWSAPRLSGRTAAFRRQLQKMRIVLWAGVALCSARYSYEVVPHRDGNTPLSYVDSSVPARPSDSFATYQMQIRESIARHAAEEADFFHNLSHHDELLNQLYIIRQMSHDIVHPVTDMDYWSDENTAVETHKVSAGEMHGYPYHAHEADYAPSWQPDESDDSFDSADESFFYDDLAYVLDPLAW